MVKKDLNFFLYFRAICFDGSRYFKVKRFFLRAVDVLFAAGDQCTQPLVEGEGTDQLRRFYADAQAKECRQFTYRGLRGNANNFLSKRECELACPSRYRTDKFSEYSPFTISVDPGPCPGGPVSQIRFCSPGVTTMCMANEWCHYGATPETTICCPNGRHLNEISVVCTFFQSGIF
jgi:hypothetical protein